MIVHLAEKITAAAQLGAIGDALGLQTEAQRSWQILEKFPHGVRTLLALNTVNIHPDYGETSEIGVISDDTWFMLAMMAGLCEKNGWNKDVQLQKLIEYYDRDSLGFGKNTRNAIEILRKGGSLPDDVPGAVGSGPATRLFPLSVWMYFSHQTETERASLVNEMTRQTHPNVTTRIYSDMHDKILRLLLSGTDDPRKNFFETMPRDQHGRSLVPHLDDLFRDEKVPTDIEIRLAYGLDEGKINGINRAFAVWNILGASYAFFLRNPDSFQAVVDAASNGGDTDSMAHIVGTMVGLYAPKVARGTEAIQLFDQLQMKDEITQSTQAFVQAF